MKGLWYLIGVLTIVLILINNPKFTSLGGFSNKSSGLNVTRSTQKNLQIIIIINICLFLVWTVLYVLSSTIY
uniref:Preprotein translocase SecG subunit n=1 Tax=Gracilaria isabellana TaxID=1183060 RepID=UPI001D12F437|nr:Preprotein translocase SecG subunit [Gracilaria isabellana]YP_010198809.1 Preprotein translocase SecG subunit [Gracilaria tikvahiae]UAD86230.1 Preprotein translocase SecG subunit [Gracilaria isabellana]UAD88042.1 Preprotein translocase SecG subunit [Gracilaria tikvahiae]UAD88245.1 Preprotein translocase SecG subunit [Gracilaria tikvahiae]